MIPAPAPDYLQIVYRPELGLLVGRWLQAVSPDELQNGYHALLAAAEHWQCRCWLVDGRRRTHSHKDDTGWMMDVFFPLLAARLGGCTYLAYLFAPSHLQELTAAADVPALGYFAGRPYQVARFIEEQAAMHWLQAAQRSVPAQP